jgi:hypothetical protein
MNESANNLQLHDDDDDDDDDDKRVTSVQMTRE